MPFSIPQFMIFLVVVLTVYIGGTYFVYRHLLWTSLPVTIRIALLLVSMAFPLGMTLFRMGESMITRAVALVGNYYLGALLYLFLLFLLSDLGLLIAGRLFGVVIPLSGKRLTVFSVVAVTVLLLIIGTVNERRKQITRITVEAPSSASLDRPLTLVFVSDVHMGTITTRSSIEKLAKMIMAEKPDLVLYGGDLMDRSMDEVAGRGYDSILRTVTAPLGVYAITGNHELFGGMKKNMDFEEECGARPLLDGGMEVGGFYLAGRLDHAVKRFGIKRKSLREVLQGNTKNLPVILLDHSPYDLQEVSHEGVFLSLWGHTHHGQMFPVNLITSSIFEVSYGYKRKGESHVFVSSGYGTWGPPLRIGTKSEILVATIIPGKKSVDIQ
jgi:uncharacterized protein